jgi:diadenosine tetraphosphate (Ap4A) HIT family hydrolase
MSNTRTTLEMLNKDAKSIHGQSVNPVYKVSDGIDGENAILLETANFNVIVPRNNQGVPGVLRIVPKDARLNNWDNFRPEDEIELLKLQGLLEFILISALDNRDSKIKPEDDKKLINFYAKQVRNPDNSLCMSIEVVPRYSTSVVIADEKFVDERFGKPFDFKNNRRSISALSYAELINLLRRTASAINLDHYTSQLNKDSFSKTWEKGAKPCISCKDTKDHPTGLAHIATRSSGIAMHAILDGRDQRPENQGRGFVEFAQHISGIRYLNEDQMIAIFALFKVFRDSINEAYPLAARTFDFACLMNLARDPEGCHVHFHVIPRTPGEPGYGNEYDMDPTKYQPLAESRKQEVLADLRVKFMNHIARQPNFRQIWPIPNLVVDVSVAQLAASISDVLTNVSNNASNATSDNTVNLIAAPERKLAI